MRLLLVRRDVGAPIYLLVIFIERQTTHEWAASPLVFAMLPEVALQPAAGIHCSPWLGAHQNVRAAHLNFEQELFAQPINPFLFLTFPTRWSATLLLLILKKSWIIEDNYTTEIQG